MIDKKTAGKTLGTAANDAKNAAAAAKGKIKATTGRVVGNYRLQAEGKIGEAKGRIMQTGQKVKESLKK